LVNEYIPYKFKTVLVIRPDGTKAELSRDAALREAEDLGLDLFCVSPNSNPPVCKILNYSKYSFIQKKKDKEKQANERREKELREIKFSPVTEMHDLEPKINKAKEFLEKNTRIRITIFMKGRLITKVDKAEELMKIFINELADYGTITKGPIQEGKNYYCTMIPKKKKN